jgi:hypothetical protein
MDAPLNTPKPIPPVEDGPLIVRHPDLITERADTPSYWPIAIVVGAMLAGLLIFGSYADKPNTQVGQNAHRPAITNPNPVIAPPVPQ